MPWLSITLQLDGAAAEALSDALLEAGAHSVALETCGEGRQTLSALLDAGADPDAILGNAARAAGVETPKASIAAVPDRDWVRESQSQFEPYAVERRLWVGPSWIEPPSDIEAHVRIDPGLAFGTGSHATTRLVLRHIAHRLPRGRRVLDYGCGSGILAIAAAKLGAASVAAVDIDPQALETTSANALSNGVAVEVYLPDALQPALYDSVVSNILAQPLIVLAPLLAARTAAGGSIALSGVLESQAAEVAAAYAPSFVMHVAAVEEGWALLEGRRL